MSPGTAGAGARIVLGTAQFGSDYGVMNTVGRVGDAELERMLTTALDRGIRSLDTSLDYGDAETRLAPWVTRFRVVTKCKARDPRGLDGCIAASMAALGVARLDGVLVHDWHALSQAERLACAAALQAMRESGVIEALGVSVYTAAEIAAALEAFDRLDIVQVPSNALDQRLLDAPVVESVREQGGRVQVRSVLLQGHLAGPGSTDHPHVRRFLAACDGAGVAPVVAALAWVRGLPWADELVVGATSEAELDELLDAWVLAADVPRMFFDGLASTDLDLIDPRRWA